MALILQAGANIDKATENGYTAFHWTIHRRNQDMLEFLFEMGADIEAKENRGLNALDLCIAHMNYSGALFLLDKTDLQLKSKEEYL